MPDRAELKKLAQAHLKDAHILYNAGRYDGAAYLCGYALEMALKACICRRLRVCEYPEARLRGVFKTHNFDDLALLAGVEAEVALQTSTTLYTNWSIATEWKPEWRYRPPGTASRKGVAAMLRSLEDPSDGVLSWLKRRW